MSRLYVVFGIILAILAILGGFYALGSHNSLKAERARMAPVIEGYQRRIDALVAQLADMGIKLENANAAVEQLQADAEAREKSAAAQIKAARTEADRFRLKAREIAAAKPTGDQCIAARNLIVETLSEERK